MGSLQREFDTLAARLYQLETNPLLQTSLAQQLHDLDAKIEDLRVRNKQMKMMQKNRGYFLVKQTKEVDENINKDVVKLKNKNDQY